MIKKIILFFSLVFLFIFWGRGFIFVNASWGTTWGGNSRIGTWVYSTWFVIDLSKIVPWWTSNNDLRWTNSKETLNKSLWNIIKKLMLLLTMLSLLIMTIWAWYMIIYHWQDEFLSKWKNIFMAWIWAMVISLSSYYIVSLVTYILYNNN